MPDPQTQYPHLPPDDLSRTLTSANPDHEGKLPHIGLVGDTYTITVDGGDTNGRFCVVDITSLPAVALDRIAMTLKKRSSCWMERSKQHFAERNPSAARAKQSTFLPMLRISSTTHPQTRLV